MRQAVVALLLVPMLALAGETATQTVAVSGVSLGVVNAHSGGGRPSAGLTVGSVDTIGGTTYDYQFGGPIWRAFVSSGGGGMYVVWMYSSSMSGSSFADRNMRYNYYDGSSHSWVYGDPDFMSAGVNAFPRRSGYGSVDADTGGTPFFSCHATLGGSSRPWVARGESGGYSDTTLPSCMWPPIAVGRNGAIHLLALTGSYDLVYCRIAPDSWPHWSTPMTGILPSPGFPSQNIAASKVSNKVALVWEVSTSGQAYLMQSTDGGLNWGSPTALTPPDAYGGDTATRYGTQSLFPFYDRHDRLHVVVNLMPVINDTVWVVPSQIWHYCPDNSQPWSRIHVAGCNPAHLMGSVGLNATYACRPTIGEDRAGGLYVAWEQFDSSNVEPTTSRLRADIFYAKDNGDNGESWQQGTRLTDQGTWSCRFPSAIDYFPDDSFRVSYLIDSVAGFFVQSEGAASRNPVVVRKVPVTVGIAEGREPAVAGAGLSVGPNPFGRATLIRYQLGRAGAVALTIHDVAGKAVRRLARGSQAAGLHYFRWNGRDDVGRALPTGVYFCTLDVGAKRISREMVMTQ